MISQVQPLQTRRSCWKVIQVVLFSLLVLEVELIWDITTSLFEWFTSGIDFARLTFSIAHLAQQVLTCTDQPLCFSINSWVFKEIYLNWKRTRKAKEVHSSWSQVKFSQIRGMLGGGFMIGKMEGETISDRFAKQSTSWWWEWIWWYCLQIAVLSYLQWWLLTLKENQCLREAVVVMPGHTTAVRGVVLQDQFVRWRDSIMFAFSFPKLHISFGLEMASYWQRYIP